ncbi:putative transporter [Smittium mucronatum]|uniref:Putative transporter n=1 Tax=Smittium mucronatum TaxID=133383 RepID=A0A1R0GYT3_9FUNG|nr:putative transporter [Smittium mucronatum]
MSANNDSISRISLENVKNQVTFSNVSSQNSSNLSLVDLNNSGGHSHAIDGSTNCDPSKISSEKIPNVNHFGIDIQDRIATCSSTQKSVPLSHSSVVSLDLDSQPPDEKSDKAETPGKDGENLSVGKKYFIVSTLCLAVFLSSLDSTMVSTALPSIANEFQALSSVSWIVTSNLLCTTAFQPLYGRMSNIFGRKESLMFSIVIFVLGSIISGVAKSIPTLIISRGITGMGGAGISVMVNIVISDLVSMQDRGKYAGLIGVAFGIASVTGPLLGGVFSDKLSWRWCFYINIPIGVFIFLIFWKTLHLSSPVGNWKDKMRRIDFLGLALIVAGLTMIILAMNWGGVQYSWTSPIVLCLFIFGFIFIVIFSLVELYFAKEPILPLRLFKIRNVWAIVIIQLAIGSVMYNVIYYMPMYYSVVYNGNGSSSGLFLLPFIIGMVITSLGCGLAISYTGRYKIYIQVGSLMVTTGLGLISTFSSTIARYKQVIYLAITGLGISLINQPAIICIQVSSGPKNLATATATIIFFRILAGTLGISLFSALLKNHLDSKLADFTSIYPEYTSYAENAKLSIESIYNSSTPLIARTSIVDAYVKSIEFVFRILTPIAGIGFLLSFILIHINFTRK